MNPETGSIKLNYPDREPWELEHPCSLRVAADGEHSLEDVGILLSITREAVRQTEATALVKLRRQARKADDGVA